MKKLLTLLVAVLCSIGMWSADPVYYKISNASFNTRNDSTVLTWTISSNYSVKNTAGVFVEVPDNAEGQVFFECNGSNTGRWLYINVNGAQDDKRKMAYAGSGKKVSINFTPADFTVVEGVNYLKFTTSDDFKLQKEIILICSSTPVTNPVAEVNISGPTKGTKDYAVTYTATTDVKADAYQWFVNDVAQNEAVGKTFTFTPTAIGDYSIVCKARNANNASDEWIASSPIVFKVYSSLFGEIIKATLTSGSAATVTGLIGGTADVSLSSSKKMDKGKYFGITLASGAFAEGDTVVVTLSAAGQNYPCLFADKNKTTLLYLATETSSDLEYKIILPAAANGLTSLYFARDANDEVYKWNPTFNSVAVVRPMPAKSTVETLKAVSINDEPLGETDFAKLLAERTLILEKSYVTAPVIKFTKHVVVTYEDESTKETDEVIEKTSQQSQASTWGAMVNIAGVAYSVYTVKATSYTVTYKEGEQVLGSELVAANGNPAEFAKYEKKPLATFDGWFKDAELTQKVESMAAEVISADVTFYAKFSKAYATSVNIEQWILDNGKDNAAFKTVLENAHIYYENINDLDSLNDLEKKDRNEPYLGLKLKAKGAKIAFNLKKGEDAVKVKFGQVSDSLLLSINGESRVLRVEDTKDSLWLGVNPAIDRYVEIITTTNATVVLKQIMINDTIKDVELPEQTVFPINITAENGKVTAAWEGKGDKHISAPAGVTVTLTFTPNKGYEFDGVTLDGEELKAVEDVYSFTMPAKAVAVVATFKQSATAIDNTDAATKAVKVIRNGQLIIEKNGVRYNAQGAVVR